MTPSNVEELTADFDLLLDGTDNFETRYLLNDLSVKRGVPWIYGAAIGSYGVVMPIVPERGPCFRCIYQEPPMGIQPTCDVNGIISPTTATVAAWQVSLASSTDYWMARFCMPNSKFRYLDRYKSLDSRGSAGSGMFGLRKARIPSLGWPEDFSRESMWAQRGSTSQCDEVHQSAGAWRNGCDL